MIQMIGTVKARRLWTCRQCGTQEYGTWVRVETPRTYSVDATMRDEFRQGTLDFPVGWSNHGADGADCSACKRV